MKKRSGNLRSKRDISHKRAARPNAFLNEETVRLGGRSHGRILLKGLLFTRGLRWITGQVCSGEHPIVR